IEPLDDGEDATGYSIAITHHRPAPVGTPLRIVATVAEVDERQCTADVTVIGPFGVVGTARFVQRYVRRDWLDAAERP
ncbi:MAG TPA: hotdog domain-containing protein, partial [Actinomycetota bacterium]